MAKKKEIEEKRVIKQFKDKSSNWFLDNVHYHLNEEGEIIFCAGGIESEEDKEYLRQYIKRNKKVFAAREPSIFEQEEKDYSIVNFGKFAGKSTMMIVAEDKKYARWLYENTTDEKIKSELKELLKK